MKKLGTLFMAATMVCSISTGVFANPLTDNIQCEILNQIKDKTITCNSLEDCYQNLNLDKLCEELGINKNCIQFSQNCPIANQNCKPDTDVDKPDNNQPDIDIDKPDNNQPDIDVDKPDNNQPDTDKPDDNKGSEDNITDSQVASEIVKLVNQERAKAGLSALKTDSKVQASAQVRAQEQQTIFSHTRPNGTQFYTALAEQGVQYNGAGENIAMGQKTPSQVMNDWMNSDGHRANILNRNFTTIGVGYYEANGSTYWSQMFTY